MVSKYSCNVIGIICTLCLFLGYMIVRLGSLQRLLYKIQHSSETFLSTDMNKPIWYNREKQNHSTWEEIDVYTIGEGMENLARSFESLAKLGFRPKNILDIGANKGLWSLAAYKYFNESNYYLIEASSRHAPKLHKMQVPYCISLVGSRTKVVEFYELKNPHQVSTGSSIYKENTHHFDNILPIRKVMHSLDTLLEGFPIIQFLKIDVQGAELDVLRGAGSTLKGVEVLIVEVSVLNYNKGSPLAIEVLSYLRDVGFEIFDIADTISIGKYQTLLQIDFVLVKHDSPYFKIAEEQLQE